MHKTIKEIDIMILTKKYKLEENKEEIMKTNNSILVVMVNNILYNYAEAILKYLWQIHKDFPNS